MSILTKIFGDENKNYFKKLQPEVDAINGLEKNFRELSDERIKDKTAGFKDRLAKGAVLDDILPEAFALAREAARRNLGQRHFDVQLMGGIVLHQGKIAEMKTGEGKTLTATAPVYLNALSGEGVHLVTVNDYLARRDCVWMGQVYHALGLSTGCINHDQSFLYDPNYKKAQETEDTMRDNLGSFHISQDFLRPCSRREAYAADITYGTNNEFGFDYLRDNMAYRLEDKVQRGFNYAIVDEVDSILIDEARTPLIISAPDEESSKWYQDFARVIPQLKPEDDYKVDEKDRAATLTESGIAKVERIMGMENIYEEKGIKYLHHLEQALRAQALYKPDRDYVVKDGQVIIIDEFTGRLMPGRRWSGGLHQAIEAKEGVKVQAESLTLASITFQNLFKGYKKLAGMTGTALTSAEEFDKVYGLDSVPIPTNNKLARVDLPDRIYKTERGKFLALVAEIKERNKIGQPMLVGTRSVEKNEYLGKLLEREGIKHEILNAKNHEREGEIIAQAGRYGAVTIATNMAGRGVDIILGGNPSSAAEAQKVRDAGGLLIVGTERHEARRIDNQLRGRAGRQGDPGTTQFFISTEDDLVRIFAGEAMRKLMDMLKVPEDQPIESGMVSKRIEEAQTKIEGANFDIRKHLLDYDSVLNKHREVIYKKRDEILQKSDEEIHNYIMELVEKGQASDQYAKREAENGKEAMIRVGRFIALKTIDFFWQEHLEMMDSVRDSVRLRAYGQQDPLVEYKSEANKQFRNLLDTVEANILQNLLNVSINPNAVAKPEPKKSFADHSKIDRNSPCPCGSGKKYKKCCGR
ncbi:MAG: preprotein translocase subunit SecA [Minisyncoccales bacterium]